MSEAVAPAPQQGGGAAVPAELACGLIMPIASQPPYEPGHWDNVREVLERAIIKAGYQPQPVWEGTPADIIQDRIVTNLYNLPLAVCDASGLNPNVMVELGMRLSFGKPVVIVTDDLKRLPFDTSIIEHVEYPQGLHFLRVEAFIGKLADKLKAQADSVEAGTFRPYIKNFGPIEFGKLDGEGRAVGEYILQRLDGLSSEVRELRLETATGVPGISRLEAERAAMVTKALEMRSASRIPQMPYKFVLEDPARLADALDYVKRQRGVSAAMGDPEAGTFNVGFARGASPGMAELLMSRLREFGVVVNLIASPTD